MASSDGYRRCPRGIFSDPGGVVIYNPETLETVENLRWNSDTNTLIIDGTLQAGDMVYSFTDLEQLIEDANDTANAANNLANDALTAANSANINANNRVAKAGDTMTGQLVVPSIRSLDTRLIGANVGGKRYFDVSPVTNNSGGLRVTSALYNAEIALNSNSGTSNYLLQADPVGNFTLQETVASKTIMNYTRSTDSLAITAANVSINGASISAPAAEGTASSLPSSYGVGFTVTNGGSSTTVTNGWPSLYNTIFTTRYNDTRAFQIMVSKSSDSLWFRSVNDINDWSPANEIMTVNKHIVNSSSTSTSRVWSSTQTKNYVDTSVSGILAKSGDTMTGQLVVPSIRTLDTVLTGVDVGGKKYVDVTASTNSPAGIRVTSGNNNAEIALNSNGGGANYQLQADSAGNFTLQETVGLKTLMLYNKAGETLTIGAADISLNGTRVESMPADVYSNTALPSAYKVGFTVGGGDSSMPIPSGTLFTTRSNTVRGLQLLASKGSGSLFFRSINTTNDWANWGELMQAEKHIVNSNSTATDRVWSSQQTKNYVDSQTPTAQAKRVYYYRISYRGSAITGTGFSEFNRDPAFNTIRYNGVGFGNLSLTSGSSGSPDVFGISWTRPLGIENFMNPTISLQVSSWDGGFGTGIVIPRIETRNATNITFSLRDGTGGAYPLLGTTRQYAFVMLLEVNF